MKNLSALALSFLLAVFAAGNSIAQERSTLEKSTDEIARELANPNTALATLTSKLQFRSFEGTLPNADDQDSTTLLFQPALPFPLKNGDKIIFRPAIPFLINQPAFNSANQNFDDESGLGDIVFDLVYAKTSETGLLTAGGIVASVPTATDDKLGSDRFTLGPEFFIGKLSKKSVLGLFPNHQWDIGGSGDADINLTTIQFIGVYLPAGGWNAGSSPIMTFDHTIDEWTIPLNFTFGKTVMMNDRPWKLSMEINYYINYYVEQPDAFGPRWMVGFSAAPVVKNLLANLFK